MAKAIKPELGLIADVRSRLDELRRLMPTLSKQAANKAMGELHLLISEVESTRSGLDPIKDPGASFDPGNPDTAGRLVALALLAQERVPLERIARTYGSGVYAIYYEGDHPAYIPVSKTETPLYVGKADPKLPDARTSREQGPQLYGRLADHRRMIRTVGDYAKLQSMPNPLRIEDFHCRRLVCATNAQLVAERHLISAFNPIWNNEVGICWGISKHGDAAKTRKNKRSPWDVLHPGRIWAMHEDLEDKMSESVILSRIEGHFQQNPPSRSRVRIIREFLLAFAQNAAMTPGEETLLDDELISEQGDLPL